MSLDLMQDQVSVVTQKTIDEWVDYFTFLEVNYWPDGYVFHALVALNALGFRTNSSCEGSNPAHRNQEWNGSFTMPIISFDDNIPITLKNLIESFESEHQEQTMCLTIDDNTKNILSLKRRTGVNQEEDPYTQEEYTTTVKHLRNFASWLERHFFEPGISMDSAFLRKFSHQEEPPTWQLDDHRIHLYTQPAFISMVQKEYESKGLPISMQEIIRCLQREFEQRVAIQSNSEKPMS